MLNNFLTQHQWNELAQLLPGSSLDVTNFQRTTWQGDSPDKLDAVVMAIASRSYASFGGAGESTGPSPSSFQTHR
jgi:hypothetical protein